MRVAPQFLTPLKSWRLDLITCLLIAILYIPFLLYGGIITDDWGDIRQTWDCIGFFSCYKEWFPLFSNRPLAPLPITLSTKLFSTHYSWYPLLNCAIYFCALWLSARAFSPFLQAFSRNLFFILAAVPCIALPLIASPINQLTATVAFLYWAISLNFLVAYEKKNRSATYVLTYVFLLCGFFTYEIILPLLFFTAFLPAISKPPKSIQKILGYFLRYIFPILIVLCIVLIWQKILAPQFFEDVSRLRFNASHIIRNLYTWVSVFAIQIPVLFWKAIPYISWISIAFFTLLAILFLIQNSSHPRTLEERQKWFLYLSITSLISCSLIFILSDESAVSWGYQARGLSSTWLALAITVASLTQYLQARSKTVRTLGLVFIYCFSCFSILSFAIQRDKYIESWSLQMLILKDAIGIIQNKAIGPNAAILANVPRYVPNNYNRELVFSQSWDFPAALVLYAQHAVWGGIVVDSRGKDLQNLHIKNGFATVNDQGRVDFTNLWLYDFDINTKQGTLTRLRNPMDLESLMEQWKNQ